MNLLIIVPFCSYAGKPNFPQMLEKNGGDDETRTRDLCRDSPEKLTLAKRVAEQPRMAKKLERIEMV